MHRKKFFTRRNRVLIILKLYLYKLTIYNFDSLTYYIPMSKDGFYIIKKKKKRLESIFFFSCWGIFVGIE